MHNRAAGAVIVELLSCSLIVENLSPGLDGVVRNFTHTIQT